MASAALRRVGASFLPLPAGRPGIAAALIAGAAAAWAPTVSRKALKQRVSPTRSAISRLSLLSASLQAFAEPLKQATHDEVRRGPSAADAARRRHSAAPPPWGGHADARATNPSLQANINMPLLVKPSA